MYDLIASLLAFFYKLIPDYGVAIALLTVAVTDGPPHLLTLRTHGSMMMMQNIQPEMKKLQSQYKDDRQKLNEELLKFYKENNINPLSGCLPLLIQIPVFFVLVQRDPRADRDEVLPRPAGRRSKAQMVDIDSLVHQGFDPRSTTTGRGSSETARPDRG